jgi:hypothetical protein
MDTHKHAKLESSEECIKFAITVDRICMSKRSKRDFGLNFSRWKGSCAMAAEVPIIRLPELLLCERVTGLLVGVPVTQRQHNVASDRAGVSSKRQECTISRTGATLDDSLTTKKANQERDLVYQCKVINQNYSAFMEGHKWASH